MYPPALPIGTPYPSRLKAGATVLSEYVGTLTYRWGAKSTSGMDPHPYYCIPVLGGLVNEWVDAELIFPPLPPTESLLEAMNRVLDTGYVDP